MRISPARLTPRFLPRPARPQPMFAALLGLGLLFGVYGPAGAQVTLPTLGNLTYAAGDAVDVTLPMATGGDDLVYTLSGADDLALAAAVPGLTFTPGDRRMFGTVQRAGTTPLTYAAGGASRIFMVRVTGPRLLAGSPADWNEYAGTLIDIAWPRATGAAPFTYAMFAAGEVDASDAVPGVAFTPASRRWFGVPTLAGSYALTYRATDRYGNAVTADFNMIVRPPFFVFSLSHVLDAPAGSGYIYSIGSSPARTTARPVTTRTTGPGGVAVGEVVPGLSFVADPDGGSGGILAGRPTKEGSSELFIGAVDRFGNFGRQTAQNGARSDAPDNIFNVFPPMLGYLERTYHFIEGRQITPITLPVATDTSPGIVDAFIGGTTLSYALSGADNAPASVALPPGLAYDAASRVLSGTPTATGRFDLTYSADPFFLTAILTSTADIVLVVRQPLALPEVTVAAPYPAGQALTLPLPPASGGAGSRAYTLTGPNDSDLTELPGLVFTTSGNTSTLSGTPTKAGDFMLTYRVRNGSGAPYPATAAQIFTLRVTGPEFDFAATDPLRPGGPGIWQFQRAQAAAATLPSGSGAAPLTYALDGLAAFADLNFNNPPTPPTVTGTPASEAEAALTYRLTDTHGNVAELTFTASVLDEFLPASVDLTYAAGAAISLTLAEAVGFTANGYDLLGPGGNTTVPKLPAGLVFDDSNRVLEGTPTAAAATALVYSASDGIAAVMDMFTLTITGPAFTAAARALAERPQTYAAGGEITPLTLPQAESGYASLDYTLTGPNYDATDAPSDLKLPAGLVFSDARELSGAPNVAGSATLTYTATDAGGNSTEAMFEVDITRVLPAVADMSAAAGAVLSLTLPPANGGGDPTYTLTATPDLTTALPGLSFIAADRVLSGTPGDLDAAELTYAVVDGTGTAVQTTFTVRIIRALAAPDPAAKIYPAGAAIEPLTLAAASGGGAPAYSLAAAAQTLAEALPGLTFDVQNRVLRGTPTRPVDAVTLTYAATDNAADGDDVTTATFSVAVTGPRFEAAAADLTYLVSQMLQTTLPAASGAISYTLTGPNGVDLSQVDGIDFTAARVLRGTPTATAATPLTYSAIGGQATPGTASEIFTLRINNPLSLQAPNSQIYSAGEAITQTLREASGGVGMRAYRLVGPNGVDLSELPGLAFDPPSRLMSGMIDQISDVMLKYSVSDPSNVDGVDSMFRLQVTGPTVTAPTDLSNYAGVDFNHAFPAATGAAPFEYALTGADGQALAEVAPGLGFDQTNPFLFGFATTAGVFDLQYSATDRFGNTTSVDVTVTILGPAFNSTFRSRPPLTHAAGSALDLFHYSATFGARPFTYSLTGAGGIALGEAVPGLTYAQASTPTVSNAGRITGTPYRAGAYVLTFGVTDAYGNFTAEIIQPAGGGDTTETLLTITGPVFATLPGDISYVVDTVKTVTLPAASGAVGYALTTSGGGNLPSGLNFNAGNRTVSGSSSVIATTALTYAATGSVDAAISPAIPVVSEFIRLVVQSPLAFTTTPTVAADGYAAGVAVSLTLPDAAGVGSVDISYTLTGPDYDATDAPADLKLPSGLVFDATERILSGTPTAAADTLLTYTAEDGGGNTAVAMLDFIVTGPMFTAADRVLAETARIYPAGGAIDPSLTLPEAESGYATLDYTLTGPGYDATDAPADLKLPAGLEFNPAGRVLSGTPSTPMAAMNLTYTATDGGGNAGVAMFAITITRLAFNAVEAALLVDKIYAAGGAIAPLTLPTAEFGYGALEYTLTGPGFESAAPADLKLPAGLAFDADDRVLSGIPTAAEATPVTLVYTATDAGGSSDTVMFNVTITGPNFTTANRTLAETAQTYPAGGLIDPPLTLPAAESGYDSLHYTLTGPGYNATEPTDLKLPAGLDFDADNRELSGTPSGEATVTPITLTYTATDAGDNTVTAMFTVTITGPNFTTANRTLAETAQTYPAGGQITPPLTLPEAESGYDSLEYTLTGPGYNATDAPSDLKLPAGLDFDADERVLGGTPSGEAGVTTLTYTATDAGDNTVTAMFTVTITGPDFTTANRTLAETAQTYPAGGLIDPPLTLPAAESGYASLHYTLTGPGYNATDAPDDLKLPIGLNFDAQNRVLSGTPRYPLAAIALTYTAADAAGNTTSAMFDIAITGPTFAAADVPLAGRTYTLQVEIDTLTLPEVAAGSSVGDVTYSLVGPGGDATDRKLPAGLVFTEADRELSGVPTTVATTELTYSAEDDNATSSVTFSVRVNSSLSIAAIANPPDHPAGMALAAIILPTATGGDSDDAIYRLTGPDFDAATDPSDLKLPAGLVFTPSNRQLTGTPTAAAATLLTYTATAGGNTAMTMFTLTVTGPMFTADNRTLAETARIYPAGGEIDPPLILPAAESGYASLDYTLTGPGYVATDDPIDLKLPAGLEFNPASRTLSGTPSTPMAAMNLTYTATDAGGNSVTAEFPITIAALAFTVADLALLVDKIYPAGGLIAPLTLPTVEFGYASLVYTLTGPGYNATTDPTDLKLPAGLDFDADERVLSGTPSGEAGEMTLTYTAADAGGNSAAAMFDVTITGPMFADADRMLAEMARNYPAGGLINPPLTLPEAESGYDSLDYTLTGPGYNATDAPSDLKLPAGLMFDADNRELSGTPSGEAGEMTLIYTAVDAGGNSVVAMFDVTITGPMFADADRMLAEMARNYPAGGLIDPPLTLPEAESGYDSLDYTLTGPGYNAAAPSDLKLPAGLDFDADNRELSGTPSGEATVTPITLTYTATDAGDNTVTAMFTVTITGPNFTTANRTLAEMARNYPAGGLIDPPLILPEAESGYDSLDYTLTGPGYNAADAPADLKLPIGLNFDAQNRVLGGTPLYPLAAIALTYTAADAAGNTTSAMFDIAITGPTFAAADVPLAGRTYTLQVEIDTLTLPEVAAGSSVGDVTYSLVGPGGDATDRKLPAGLVFTEADRELSGVPTTVATTELTYSAEDDNAISSVTFSVRVNSSLSIAAIANPPDHPAGMALAAIILPTATGGDSDDAIYRLTGPDFEESDPSDLKLPAGLVFTPSNRQLTGTPTTAAATLLTYTATAGGNTAMTMFTLTVTGPMFTADNRTLAETARIYPAGGEIDPPLTLPAAESGYASLDYTLTGPGYVATDDPIDLKLPAGLEFNPASRTLSGTPSTPMAAMNLTYTATDAGGNSVTAEFPITIAALAFTVADLALLVDKIYPAGGLIAPLTLPAVEFGYASLVYTLTGPGYDAATDPADLKLPAGLDFDADDRVLSGTPTAAATPITLIYTAQGGGANSAVAMFDVTITGPMFADADRMLAEMARNYPAGGEIDPPLILPEAESGYATLEYTLTGPGYDAAAPADLKLPAGLMFDADNRELSGTPSGEAGEMTLIYTAVDAGGNSVVAMFDVTITGPMFADADRMLAEMARNYPAGGLIDPPLTLPEAESGYDSLDYTLTGPGYNATDAPSDLKLPAGLDFDADNRELSGTPSGEATVTPITLTYTATDAGDNTVTAMFTVTITGPNFTTANRTLAETAQTYPAGGLIDPPLTLPEAESGYDSLDYTLTGPNFNESTPADLKLPIGLNFDAQNRVLSGTPRYPLAAIALTYTAADAGGNTTSAMFDIAITGPTFATEVPTAEQTYTLQVEIEPLTLPLVAAGSTGDVTYSLVGPGGDASDRKLPAGLVFTEADRELSGVPTTVATTELTYSIQDANATSSATFSVRVNPTLALAVIPTPPAHPAGMALAAIDLPPATGGGSGAAVYRLTGPNFDESDPTDLKLPAGLVFTPSNRQLSGTPTAAAATLLTYTATAGGNTAMTMFTLTVTGPMFTAENLALAETDQTYAAGGAIDPPLTLPEAESGYATLDYTLTGPGYTAPADQPDLKLPIGLVFDVDNRVLSGSPTTSAAEMMLTYTATDAGGNATVAMFDVTITGPRFTTADQTLAETAQIYPAGGLIDPPLTLPTAEFDYTGLIYTLTGPGYDATATPADLKLPAGLNFDPSNRVLSGTPTTSAAAVTLTYSVTEPSAAANATAMFAVTITGPRFTTADRTLAETAQIYPAGGLIDPPLTLPAAEFDYVGLIYALTGPGYDATATPADLKLPAGLAFDPSNRVLSGTPTTSAAAITLTYSVTEPGAAANATAMFAVTITGPAFTAADQTLAETAQIYPAGGLIDPPLTLPAAEFDYTGLIYALTGPGYDATATPADLKLPAGLNFDPSNRVLSGTPTTSAAAVTLTYSVTEPGAAANATAMFAVTITGPRFTTADRTLAETAQIYPAGGLIDPPLTLPTAEFDYTGLIYTLTGPGYDATATPADLKLPAGLNFDPSNRVLSGTPTTSAAAVTLTYSVTEPGAAANATAMFTVTITGPRFTTADQTLAETAQIYPAGGLIDPPLTLPTAEFDYTGLIYTLTGPGYDATDAPADLKLPAGLNFDPSNRVLSGTPTTSAAAITLTYSVTEPGAAANATAMFTVTITGPAFTTADRTLAEMPQNYPVGGQIAPLTLPMAESGYATLDYTLLGESGEALAAVLPGLAFNADGQRILRGTPTRAVQAAALVYTATDDGGNAADLTFRVSVGRVFVDADGQPVSAGFELTFAAGDTITHTLPTASGGGSPYYRLLGANLEAIGDAVPGLTFDDDTLILSGTPRTAEGVNVVYSVAEVATDAGNPEGEVTLNFSILITGPQLAALPDLRLSVGQSAPQTLPPAASAALPLTYALTGPGYAAAAPDDLKLPAGLAFDAAERVLSGRPQAEGVTAVLYTITDRYGNVFEAQFDIDVTELVFAGAPLEDKNYPAGVAIIDLTLPAASGNVGILSYTLFGPGGTVAAPNLPPGLAFEARSRVLSGTPQSAVARLTYTAADSMSSISAIFTLTIVAAPVFAADLPLANQTYVAGGSIDPPLTLPIASGAPDYTLTAEGAEVDSVLAGLMFDAANRVLSGTPAAAMEAAVTLTYVATDAHGATATAMFSVLIRRGFSEDLPSAEATAYTPGQMVALTLPLATGGGDIEYSLTGPNGTDLSEADAALIFEPSDDNRLVFDAADRRLSGMLDKAGSIRLTYRAGPAAGGAGASTAGFAAAGAGFAAAANGGLTIIGTIDITVNGPAFTTEQLAQLPASTYYPVDVAIDPLTLPTASAVDGLAYLYTLTGPGNAAVGGAVPGLSFDASNRILSGTPSARNVQAMLTYAAADQYGNMASANFEVTTTAEAATATAAAINKILLPEAARVIADSAITAVTTRLAEAGGGAQFAIGGQSSMAGLLARHGASATAEDFDSRKMLAGSAFSWSGKNDADGGASAIALWGRGEYREMSGQSAAVNYRGTLRGFHLGADARVRDGVRAGASVSQLRSAVDYTDGGAGLGDGAQTIDMTSVHPYLGWRVAAVDLWALVGLGEGEVETTPAGQARVSNRLDMRSISLGLGGDLWPERALNLRLKGEASSSRLEVAADDAIAAQVVQTSRVRLAVEASQTIAVASGSIAPALEIGLHHSGGAGGRGTLTEFGAGLRYHNRAAHLAAHGRVRALLGTDGNYREWGIQGSLGLQPGADGQGLSMRLTSGYGDSGSSVQQLWRALPAASVSSAADSAAGNAAAEPASADYRARLEARFGYGLSLRRHPGLLTPYSEFTIGETPSHRIGIQWRPDDSLLTFNLLGEHRDHTTGAASAIVFKGEARF